jgi:hypothetical protein
VWHTIAVGSTGPYNAGTMWHFSDAGVTCSGKFAGDSDGIRERFLREREKKVTQYFVHVESKNK